MKRGDTFVRIRKAQGLPSDYPLKDHHREGYRSVVERVFRHRILDVRGFMHGKINVSADGANAP